MQGVHSVSWQPTEIPESSDILMISLAKFIYLAIISFLFLIKSCIAPTQSLVNNFMDIYIDI